MDKAELTQQAQLMEDKQKAIDEYSQSLSTKTNS